MRDSPVSVSALLCKRNAVCVLCHLKYFEILPGGLFFGILRFRNIGLSEHWAVPPDQYLSNSVIVFTTNKYCQISCHSAITWPRFHGNVPNAHFSDSPLFRNCEYSNVNHYSPHAHPNESHNHKQCLYFTSINLNSEYYYTHMHLHRDDTKIFLWLPTA